MNDTFMKEKPVLPLILSMAMPMVLSMLVNRPPLRQPCVRWSTTFWTATLPSPASAPFSAWAAALCKAVSTAATASSAQW